jgi:hypothetical protein
MSDIVTVDPFTPLYTYEKITNPEKQLVLRAYKKNLVEGVDRLVEKGRGRQSITTESDWALLEEIVKFFIKEWPHEWLDYKKTIPDIRQTRKSGGYNSNKEMKYVGALPNRLERLIKVIFPYQHWNKEFVNKLVKRFKIFKVGGENN